MYFDSHAHYNDERFEEDRAELFEMLEKCNVSYVVNAGADMESSLAGIRMADQYPFMYASVGVHPHDVKDLQEDTIPQLREWAKHEKVVAIGEIGLDYYYNHSEEQDQVKWFTAQLELAKELEMPVIIHSREACQATFDIITKSGVREGVIHCFSGSKELAKEYIKKGFYIGIGGSLTFKNARKTVEVVEAIPLTSILIETDAPYLTPVPHRGKRNDSSYLKHVVEKIAEIKGITPEEVEVVTEENAKRLFRL